MPAQLLPLVAQSPAAPQARGRNEVFLTTHFHDSLNRLERTVNNLGHALDYRYDSRNNLVAPADAQGPVPASPPVTISRRAFSGGALTVNQINSFVRRETVDSASHGRRALG